MLFRSDPGGQVVAERQGAERASDEQRARHQHHRPDGEHRQGRRVDRVQAPREPHQRLLRVGEAFAKFASCVRIALPELLRLTLDVAFELLIVLAHLVALGEHLLALLLTGAALLTGCLLQLVFLLLLLILQLLHLPLQVAQTGAHALTLHLLALAGAFLEAFGGTSRGLGGLILIALAAFGLTTSLGITRVPAADPEKRFRANFVTDFFTQLVAVRRDRVLFLGVLLLFFDRMSMTVKRLEHATYIDTVLVGLCQVLALLPDGKQLVIELKCGTDALPELARVIAASRKAAARVELIC